MANRGDQLGSPGLRLLETLHIYPPNWGPELGTVLQQALPVPCRGQAMFAYSGSGTPALYSPGSFAPFAPQLYIAQSAMVRRDDNPYISFSVHTGHRRTKQ